MVAGSMQAMMKKMPFGGGGAISDEQLRDGEQKLKRFGAFVELMSVLLVESAVLAAPQLCGLGRLGRQSCSAYCGGAPQPRRPQWQHMMPLPARARGAHSAPLTPPAGRRRSARTRS